MKRVIYLTLLIVLSLMHTAFIRSETSQKLHDGNQLYHDGKLDEALVKYNDAQLSDPASPEILFNMGNVFYRQKKYQEAIDSFTKAMEKGDQELESKAFYNIGNSLFQQGQLREALDAYKEALERNPDDLDTKYNLEYTERKIKEMLSQAQQTMEQALKEQAKQEQAGQQEQGQQGASSKEEKGESGEDQQAFAQGEEQENGDRTEERKGSGDKDGEKGEEDKEKGKMMKESGEMEEGEESGGQERGDEEISEEDAERFLSAYEQSQSSMMPQGRQTGQSGRTYVEKDW